MSLEASLRLNGSNFLPEEEHLFYTFDSERKTTAKVFLPSDAIQSIECVVYADFDLDEAEEAKVKHGLKDQNGRKAVLHEMREMTIKASEQNGRAEWVVPLLCSSHLSQYQVGS